VAHATFVGTYKVNSDCTGSKIFTFADGLVAIVHFDFVITDGGNEIQVISTDPGLTLTASAARIANGRDRDQAVSTGSQSAPSPVADGCRDESGKAHELYRAN